MNEATRERKFASAKTTEVGLIQSAIEKASGENGRVGELFRPEVLKALADLSNDKNTLNTYQRLLKAIGSIQDVSKSDVLSATRRFKRASNTNAPASVFESLEAWREPVNGETLADSIQATFCSLVALSEPKLTAITLWALASYSINEFQVFPKLAITSPTHGVGKLKLMLVVGSLCPRALPCSDLSATTLLQLIDEWQPTLLFGESCLSGKTTPRLRQLQNAGHKRADASWAPQVLAKTGRLPDTISDKSILFELQRHDDCQPTVALPASLIQDNQPFRRQCLRWADDHSGKLNIEPELPGIELNDRALDNWAPLFSIADAIGGDWPDKARDAMQALEAFRNPETGGLRYDEM